MLQAASEIDAVLERRVDHIMGALQIARALLLACIFAFYQLVAWDPAPYVARLGGFLAWVWVVPALVMRVIDVLLTARVERAVRAAGRELGVRQWWIPPLAAALAAGALELAGRPELVPGAVLAAFGVAMTVQGERRGGTRTRFGRLWRVNAALYALVGLALLL